MKVFQRPRPLSERIGEVALALLWGTGVVEFVLFCLGYLPLK
jgi:hypothetical protein